MLNNKFGIAPESFDIILTVLKTFSQVEEVFIFGSRALATAKKGSDIDLCLKGKNVTALIAMDIAAILNEQVAIPYFIDVLSYNDIDNKELQNHIDRVGIRIYY
ncbi:MAG: nucleotidyltransferase domain-containing protein [Candidatus Margulisiibacteriota bacterium]|jgi:predicted nucleotidyltransferase